MAQAGNVKQTFESDGTPMYPKVILDSLFNPETGDMGIEVIQQAVSGIGMTGLNGVSVEYDDESAVHHIVFKSSYEKNAHNLYSSETIVDEGPFIVGGYDEDKSYANDKMYVSKDLDMLSRKSLNFYGKKEEGFIKLGHIMPVGNDIQILGGNIVLIPGGQRSNDGIRINDGSVNIPGKDVSIGGNLTVGKATKLKSTLSVDGSTSIIGDTSIGGTLSVGGDTSIGGDTTLNKTLSVDGSTSIGGDVSIDGYTSIGGTLSVVGDTSIGGDATLNKTLSVGGDVSIDGSTSIIGDTSIGGHTTINNTLSVSGISTFYSDVSIYGGTDTRGKSPSLIFSALGEASDSTNRSAGYIRKEFGSNESEDSSLKMYDIDENYAMTVLNGLNRTFKANLNGKEMLSLDGSAKQSIVRGGEESYMTMEKYYDDGDDEWYDKVDIVVEKGGNEMARLSMDNQREFGYAYLTGGSNQLIMEGNGENEADGIILKHLNNSFLEMNGEDGSSVVNLKADNDNLCLILDASEKTASLGGEVQSLSIDCSSGKVKLCADTSSYLEIYPNDSDGKNVWLKSSDSLYMHMWENAEGNDKYLLLTVSDNLNFRMSENNGSNNSKISNNENHYLSFEEESGNETKLTADVSTYIHMCGRGVDSSGAILEIDGSNGVIQGNVPIKATVNQVPDVYVGCPVGTIVMWPAIYAPKHWLLCNGDRIKLKQNYTGYYSVFFAQTIGNKNFSDGELQKLSDFLMYANGENIMVRDAKYRVYVYKGKYATGGNISLGTLVVEAGNWTSNIKEAKLFDNSDTASVLRTRDEPNGEWYDVEIGEDKLAKVYGVELLPDFRGHFPVGVDSSSSLTKNKISAGSAGTYSITNGKYGGEDASDGLPPYHAVNFIIKYE